MSIKAHFEKLLIDIQPPGGFPAVQQREMEKAFYAGFFAMQMEQLATSRMSDEAGVQHLQTLFEEAELFFKLLGKDTRQIPRN